MIGIFDSGSGGLSVLSALRVRAPQADMVYFGDIGNSPYGNRSQEELAQFVRTGMQTLMGHGATEIIAACNSISLSVLMGAAGHDRLIEMTRPTARMMRAHAGERVLLLATKATIECGIYRDVLRPIVDLDELAIPELAGAIESEAREPEIISIVTKALTTRKGQVYDKILLGCTHFPLVNAILEKEAQALFGPVSLVDPADAVAEEAIARFDTSGSGKLTFLISGDSHGFRNRIAPLFLESPCTLSII